MASKELIRKVAEASDIVSVIGAYIQLTRAGSEFPALSPFTSERSPSFFVMPAKQAFYCFSSQQGGDVFRFLQLYENLTFPEALKKLADRAGIRLDESAITPEMAAKDRHRRRVRELQGAARDWFHHLLLRSPKPMRRGNTCKDVASASRSPELETRLRACGSPCAVQLGARRTILPNRSWSMAGWPSPVKAAPESIHTSSTASCSRSTTITEKPWSFSGRILSAEQKGGKSCQLPGNPHLREIQDVLRARPEQAAHSQGWPGHSCEGQLD